LCICSSDQLPTKGTKGTKMKTACVVPDDQSLVESLRSTVCPACGGKKNRAQTFCGNDYYSIPPAARKALYNRLGKGYREAVAVAMDLLGASQFYLPPE
jgi:hypothetical protein